MKNKIISGFKKSIAFLYKQFSDLIHIAITAVLCYLCFLFSPTLPIAIIGCIVIIIVMFLLSMFVFP
ncbi:hypothetical protein AM438_03640 [Proteus mirabilis]|nr:hypothetical protein AM438_03640 [Proteus mirabilis]NHI97921.1 hypothetical protein [Proteus mirabilis]ROD52234.1 hypothetical protein C4Z11_003710 [Proteus mirabilis]TFT80405.1 hypothetical protein E4V48_12330 [Proteus mirabilis]HAU5549922.1 hypothetical protein [Proteus mirabilis]